MRYARNVYNKYLKFTIRFFFIQGEVESLLEVVYKATRGRGLGQIFVIKLFCFEN